MGSALKCSVIIPAYQAAGELRACLRALNSQTVPRGWYEVIVVDDGSADDTAGVAREEGADQVLVIPHGGPAAARNAGLEVARGEIVLFTDADCEPGPEWVERMLAPFADPEVSGAKGTYRTRQQAIIARLVQLEYEFRYERMARAPRIDFIDTYSAAYRRSVLLQAGGFDPAFPIPSAEDVDLSFRLARAGHKLVFVPDAWVWHSHPDRLGSYLRRKARYGFWRALLYLRHPDKIQGDVHTDPSLKLQFAILALAALSLSGGLLWRPLIVLSLAFMLAFIATTIPFARWAWRRDRAVAIAWPAVTLARVFVQGASLALGLAYHGVLVRCGTGLLRSGAATSQDFSTLSRIRARDGKSRGTESS